MKQVNVINYNFNTQKFESYDVIPYLVRAYNDRVQLHNKFPENEYLKVPQTFDEFKKFVQKQCTKEQIQLINSGGTIIYSTCSIFDVIN